MTNAILDIGNGLSGEKAHDVAPFFLFGESLPQSRNLHLDFETRSPADLKNVGAYVYAEHPETYVWLFRYTFDNGPVQAWNAGQPVPQDVIDHIAAGGLFTAHNVLFEWLMWNIVLPRQTRQALPRLRFEQCDCTMARALAMGLPGALGNLGGILGTETQKDNKGALNMKRMAKPRLVKSKGAAQGTTALTQGTAYDWWDEPERIANLGRYCEDDVRTERDVDEKLPPLSADDRAEWLMDLYVNGRGIPVDVDLIHAAHKLVEYAKGRMDAEMRSATLGRVSSTSKRMDLVAFLVENTPGAPTPITSLAKGAMEDVQACVDTFGTHGAKEALRIYRSANRTSTAKYVKMGDTVGYGMRSRGTMQWHGAATGRWAGRLWQPQNLPRVDEKKESLVKFATKTILEQTPEVAYDILSAYTGDVMDTLVLCVRSVICASRGHVLIGADYSNVEGRIISWLAGATMKLQAFRDYDDKLGYDLYNLAYAGAFGIDVATMPPKTFMRQVGKVLELACGYQGSIGAYINMAANYGIKPHQIAEVVLQNCTEKDYEEAEFAYRQPGTPKFDLEKEVWIGLKIAITKWRNSEFNLPIQQFWWDLQEAALLAVQNPGVVQHVGVTKLISYVMSGANLLCRLPTGKILMYTNAWVHTEQQERVKRDGTIYHTQRHSVRYKGWEGTKRRWCDQSLYGGIQANHVTQGTAAAIMKRGMRNLEAGYPQWEGTARIPPKDAASFAALPAVKTRFPCILTVHDEAVSEIPEPKTSAEADNLCCAFNQLMLSIGHEFRELPLAVSGWIDRRYVK